MRMLQPCRRLDLRQEPFAADRGGQFMVHDLDRHLTIVFQVLSEVDRGHATGTELALDPVAVSERCPKPFNRSHG